MELIYAEFSTIKSEIRFKAAVMRSSKQVGHGKISIHSQLKCKASAVCCCFCFPCKCAVADDNMRNSSCEWVAGWPSGRAWKRIRHANVVHVILERTHMAFMHERIDHSKPHNDAVHSPFRLLTSFSFHPSVAIHRPLSLVSKQKSNFTSEVGRWNSYSMLLAVYEVLLTKSVHDTSKYQ